MSYCRKCNKKLTMENTWQSYIEREHQIYLCKECDLQINKQWANDHRKDRRQIDNNFTAKKQMNKIMSKDYDAKNFGYMSIDRIEFLFQNYLFENAIGNLENLELEI